MAGQVGVAVDHRPPLHPQPAGQLVPQLGLVEQPGGLCMPVQPTRIQGAPLAVVDRFHTIGHQHVGVQQWVVGPRGAVPERRSNDTCDFDGFRAVVSAS